ncbi:MAG: DUF4386 domain-containing protein [Saprospirales bacterium]|nr:DUF4386 domain-containing protein [Saprospirales bacterium]
MKTNNNLNSRFSVSQRKAAWIAGISLLLMALVAGFSYGYVQSSLVVKGDAEATVANLSTSISLFRAGVLGWLLIFFLDIVVAWALYLFFKEANQRLSLLTACFRLAYTALLGVAIMNLISVLNLLDEGLMMAPEMVRYQVVFYLNAFEGGWSMGLVIFGIHLLLLGYLLLQSKYAHTVWGILLVLAGLSYLFVHGIKLLFPDLDQLATIEMVLSLPMAVGEIGFAFWLLIRGGGREGRPHRAAIF